MAVSDRDRKTLWGRVGSRCTMCNEPLTTIDGLDAVVGEEAHIAARNPGGPRFDATRSAKDRDAYDKLILLCSKHRKLIDDNPTIFTVEDLRGRKAKCERETAARLEPDKVGWIDAPTLHLVNTGAAVASMLGSAKAVSTSFEQPKDDEQAQMMRGFLESLSDWMDVMTMRGPGASVDAAVDLDRQMRAMDEHAIAVYAAFLQWSE